MLTENNNATSVTLNLMNEACAVYNVTFEEERLPGIISYFLTYTVTHNDKGAI